MLIKCPKCGAENPVGPLFCKDCGAKIDVKMIDQAISQIQYNRESDAKRAVFFKLVGIIILILVLIMIYLIVDPIGTKIENIQLTKEEIKTAVDEYSAMGIGKRENFTFTQKEFNYIADRYFFPKMEPLNIEFTSSDTVVVSRRVQLEIHESVDNYISSLSPIVVLTCKLEKNEVKGKQQYKIKAFDYDIGKMSYIPSSAYAYLDSIFKPYESSKPFLRFMSKIRDISVNGDNITFIIKR